MPTNSDSTPPRVVGPHDSQPAHPSEGTRAQTLIATLAKKWNAEDVAGVDVPHELRIREVLDAARELIPPSVQGLIAAADAAIGSCDCLTTESGGDPLKARYYALRAAALPREDREQSTVPIIHVDPRTNTVTALLEGTATIYGSEPSPVAPVLPDEEATPPANCECTQYGGSVLRHGDTCPAAPSVRDSGGAPPNLGMTIGYDVPLASSTGAAPEGEAPMLGQRICAACGHKESSHSNDYERCFGGSDCRCDGFRWRARLAASPGAPTPAGSGMSETPAAPLPDGTPPREPPEEIASECCGADVADMTRGPTCVKCGARQPLPSSSPVAHAESAAPTPAGSGMSEEERESALSYACIACAGELDAARKEKRYEDVRAWKKAVESLNVMLRASRLSAPDSGAAPPHTEG